MKWSQPCVVRGSSNATAGTRYFNFTGARSADSNGTQQSCATPVSCVGAGTLTIDRMYARYSAAMTGTMTRTFTLHYALKATPTTWVASNVTVTFDVNTPTRVVAGVTYYVASDLTHTLSGLVSGDLLTWKQTDANSPTAGTVAISVRCSTSGVWQLLWGTGLSGLVSNSAARRQCAQGGATANATQAVVQLMLAHGGTISDLEVALSASSGGGSKSYTVATYYDNSATGVPSVLLDSTNPQFFSDHSTTPKAVAAGHFVHTEITPANTPTSVAVATCVVYTPTTTGKAVFMSVAASSTSAASYLGIGCAQTVNTATETQQETVCSWYGRVTDFVAGVDVAPDNGAGTDKWTLAMRVNGRAVSSDRPTPVISEAATSDLATWAAATPSDSVHVMQQRQDSLSASVTPSNTPSAANVYVSVAVLDCSSSGSAESTLLEGLVIYARGDGASNASEIDRTGRGNALASNFTVGSAVGHVTSLARQFNSASSRYLSLADVVDVRGGNSDSTRMCWVYMDSKTNGQVYIARSGGGSGDDDFFLAYDNSSDRFYSTAYVATDSAKNCFFNTFGSPSLGSGTSNWYMLEGYTDSVNQQVGGSVNGTLEGSPTSLGAAPQAATANSQVFGVGAYVEGGPSLHADGRMCPVAAWDRLWTASERAEIYASAAGLDYPFTPVVASTNTSQFFFSM